MHKMWLLYTCTCVHIHFCAGCSFSLFYVFEVVEDTSTVHNLTESYLGMQSGDILNYQLSIDSIYIADPISNARLYGDSCQSADTDATVCSTLLQILLLV